MFRETAQVNAAHWLPLLHEIADRADAIALSHFRTARLAVDVKPDRSPVTAADRAGLLQVMLAHAGAQPA